MRGADVARACWCAGRATWTRSPRCWRRAASTPSAATAAWSCAAPDEDALLDAVRDAAADAGLGLRELRAAGRTLEDALVDALE